MAELEKLKNQLKLEIQSLLCTEKAAIPSYQLHKQYRSEMGSHIPYMKLGFQQLDDYLRSIPDVVSSYTIEGVLYVKAVPLQASSHINELVHGQKKAKKKKSNNNWAGRFKTFRVSSSVAPNRFFNKNYIPYRGDHCNRAAVGYSRPASLNMTPFRSPGQFDVRTQLVPQVMQPMKPKEPSVEQSPPPVVIKNPFVWKPTTPPVAFQNVNNTPCKMMNGSNLQQFDRSHLKPQIMQPRVATPVKEPEDRPNLQPQIMQPRPPPLETIINKPQLIQEDRPNLQPQIMQPRPVGINKSQFIQEDRPNNLKIPQENFISPPVLNRNFPISQWNPNESMAHRSTDVFLTPNDSISPSWDSARPTSPTEFLEGPRRLPSQLTTDLLREQMKKIAIHSNCEPVRPRGMDRPPNLVLAPEFVSPPVAGIRYLDTPSPESKPKEMYVERLKRLVDKYKLGRVNCNTYPMKNGNYIATMQVGKEKFLTYPEDFAELVDATEYAAQLACHYIESMYPI